MQGTIVKLDLDKGLCFIHNSEQAKTYQASLTEAKLDIEFNKIRLGEDCEYEVVKEPTMFSFGQAKLINIKELNLANEKVAVAYSNHYLEHEVIKDSKDYLIAGEGGSEREARMALIEKAIECKVNALLGLQLECVVRFGVKTVLFRYVARPALIEGPQYKAEPGQTFSLPTKLARRNSPNEAQVRYVRVLLICFLFIALPWFIRLGEDGTFSSPMIGQVLSAGLIVLSMIVFMFISFKKRIGYLLTLKKINRS